MFDVASRVVCFLFNPVILWQAFYLWRWHKMVVFLFFSSPCVSFSEKQVENSENEIICYEKFWFSAWQWIFLILFSKKSFNLMTLLWKLERFIDSWSLSELCVVIKQSQLFFPSSPSSLHYKTLKNSSTLLEKHSQTTAILSMGEWRTSQFSYFALSGCKTKKEET